MSDLDEKYPEHAKLMAVRDQSQAVGEFLDNAGFVLAEWFDDDSCDEGRRCPLRGDESDHLHPVTDDIQRVLEKWFEIDGKKIEDEKRAMLAEMRGDAP